MPDHPMTACPAIKNLIRLTVVALAMSAAGCATSTDVRAIQTDLNEARRVAFESRNTLSEISGKLDLLEKRVAAVEKPAESASNKEILTTVRQNQGELALRMEEIGRDTRAMQGRIEEIQYASERGLKDMNDQKELLVIRLSALEERFRLLPAQASAAQETASVKPASAGETGAPNTAAQPAIPVLVTPPAAESSAVAGAEAKPQIEEAPQIVYERGQAYYKSRDFVKSRDTFRLYIERFPNERYAGNAQFWIGETFYSEGDYENAILAYEDVLRKYKQSEKTAAAMLKQGFAFAAIGDEKTARILLDRVEKKFPGSPEADIAVSKLKTLK
jgi:tol-pal system protein YbgF